MASPSSSFTEDLQTMLEKAGVFKPTGSPTPVPTLAPLPPQRSSAKQGDSLTRSDVTLPPGFVWPVEPKDFVEADFMDYPLKIWPQIAMNTKSAFLALLMLGPRGTGKTLFAYVLAARLKCLLLIVNCNPDMDYESIVGTTRIKWEEGKGGDYCMPGPVKKAADLDLLLGLATKACESKDAAKIHEVETAMQACGLGCTAAEVSGMRVAILFDEFNVTRPSTQLIVNPLLDAIQDGMYVPQTGERITWRHPLVMFASNEGYAGTRELQPAFRDRPETMLFDYLPPKAEVDLICGRTGCNRILVESAVTTANSIRAAAKGQLVTRSDGQEVPPIEFDLSPRALISFALRVVAGQDKNEAWRDAILNRIGASQAAMPTRIEVAALSKDCGGFETL